MRVNGLLSITAGNTLVELYDDKCRYLAPITANEYFQESYDESFKEYDIDKVYITNGVLCIKIKPANYKQLLENLKNFRDNCQDFIDELEYFEEKLMIEDC
jgi:hypothetical protein